MCYHLIIWDTGKYIMMDFFYYQSCVLNDNTTQTLTFCSSCATETEMQRLILNINYKISPTSRAFLNNKDQFFLKINLCLPHLHFAIIPDTNNNIPNVPIRKTDIFKYTCTYPPEVFDRYYYGNSNEVNSLNVLSSISCTYAKLVQYTGYYISLSSYRCRLLH